MQIVRKDNMMGGKGYVTLKMLYDEKQFHGTGRLYAEVTITPGSELGWHVHKGDAESYYIISGEGTYNDNGTIRTLKPGDFTYTGTGEGHSIENKGTEDLVFMALILFD